MSDATILTNSRYLLADTGSAWWSDAVLTVHLANAKARLARLRPDILIGTTGAIGSTFAASWDGVLADLVAASALSENSADLANAAASKQLEERAMRAILQG